MAVNIGPRIGIEGEAEYRNQLKQIIAQSKTLASEMKALTASFDKNNKSLADNAKQQKLLHDQIKNQEARIQATKSQLEKATQAYNENKRQLEMHKEALTEDVTETQRLEKAVEQSAQKMQQYQIEINNATAKLNEMQGELKNMPSALDMVASKIEDMGKKLETVGQGMVSVGRTLSTAITAPVIAGFTSATKSAIDWESAFTGVMKTVDETASTTYDDLKDSINEIAKTTASSQNEIAAVMEIGGQLGITADDMAKFTRNVIMLGDTTNLSAEEAATAIARFANVTGMSIADTDRLGSVIVDLGNNYATTEADIMSMAQRLSGAGAQIGLSEGEILGFATALSSVGIEAEMGGSAFSKAMIKMQVAAETGFDQVNALEKKTGMSMRRLELMSSNNSKAFKALAQSLGMTKEEMNATIKAGNNLQDFAKVANMTTEEFVELYRKDAPAALQAFIKGLGDTEGHGESTIAMLQEMGFTEVRLRDTLTRLANSGDLVTDAVAQGNTAWAKNTAMTAEAEKRYATMATKISQLKASFTELSVEIGEMLIPYLEKSMAMASEWIEKWKGLDDETKQTILKIAAVAAAIGPLLIAGGKLVIFVGKIMQFAPQIATALQGVSGAFGGVASTAAGALLPIAAVIGIIAALAAAFANLWNNNEEFREKMIGIWEHVKESFSGFISQIEERLPKIQEAFTNVVEAVKPIWEGFCQFLGPSFLAAFQLISTILDALFNAIISVIDMITGILTADKELFMVGLQNFLLTLWTLVQETWATWWEWIVSTADVVLSFFGTSTDELSTIFETLFTVLWELITEKVTELVDFVIEKFNELTEFISSLPDQFYQWGVDMIQSLIDGIESMIGAAGDAIAHVGEVIASYIHFSEPDVGPLSQFHKWMPDMMKQMAEQIEAGRFQVRVAAAHVAGDIAAPMAGARNVTLNNSFSFGGSYTEADGRMIARQINRQLGALYI